MLKLIGAELISDEVLAITELVKNAHDADASSVTVEFREITRSEGSIVIKDDGHGMNLDVLLNHWMVPAGTSKSRPEARMSKRGRRVLGEKGVGRFAADKLARTLEVISRRAGDPHEVRALFDWDEFDSDTSMLADVRNLWEVRPASEINSQGTVLRMRGLRTVWNERMFRRMCTRLSRLRSPFAERDDFTVRIESDEFPQYSGELRSDILERAPYRIDAVFDGRQTVDINVNGSSSVEHLWNGHGDLRCGPVRVRLFAFDLDTDAMARIGPRMEVRAWLREWSGVSVYRDGFRVSPYGEPHDDWLRLDQRRVNNPVVRLSNNQVMGFVEITRDANPDLADQTNREGLLKSRAFEDLRRLIHFVLQILESERQSTRHPLASAGQTQVARRENSMVPAELEKLARSGTPEIADVLRRIAAKHRETTSREESRHRKLIEGYSELAAVGQAATGFARTARPILDRISEQLREVVRQGDRRIARRGKEIEAALRSLVERVSMLSSIEAGNRHRRRAVDIPAELEAFRELERPLLEPREVEMEIMAPRKGVLRVDMRPENLHRILHLLLINSLEWLHTVRKPRIRVAASGVGDACEIVFSDNGPGISAALAEKVFEPTFSGREGGHGMGLTIARNLVGLHGGSIEVVTDRRHRGANIRILFPRKRSRATMHR